MKPLAVMTYKRVALTCLTCRRSQRQDFREAAYLPPVWHLCSGREHQMAIVEKINDGINKAPQIRRCSASSRSPISRQVPMPLSRSRGIAEGGLREADESDQDLGYGTAK